MCENGDRSQPSLDTALDMLANKYRRRLLVTLLEHNSQDDEDFQTPTGLERTDDDAVSVQIAKIHIHLPKLEDHGFIRWDRDEDTIRKGPHFDAIQPLLALVTNHADELPYDWP